MTHDSSAQFFDRNSEMRIDRSEQTIGLSGSDRRALVEDEGIEGTLCKVQLRRRSVTVTVNL
jgi:hypothetical protein